MSQENVEAFRRGTDLVNAGDVEAAIQVTHPEVTYEPLRSGVGGAYRGHPGIRRFFADTAESFESFRLDYTDVRDLGDDRILAIGTLHIRGKESGIETDVPTAGIATFREGQVIHWKDYGDRTKALDAAGLSE